MAGNETLEVTVAEKEVANVVALAIIDQALGQVLRRELISTNEVADLLLDVRTALTDQK